MKEEKEKISFWLEESVRIKERILREQIENILSIGKLLIQSLKRGGKIIFFGNGGSAADAQHLSAELVGRFRRERKALSALSLTTNTSTITAVANDYNYKDIFVRQLQAIAKKGDVAFGISTSGNSDNVFEALLLAKHLGLKTVSLTGREGGKIARVSDYNINIPSEHTAHIQEAHITIGHILCDLIEEAFTK
ncbi:MAG: D-sedoheptulose 7-phosphate isomerase [Candidatus Omnitrophica bacterium]|nr:D-sedoheptulose 7-phosphate isomerase [Candidatus Omnitrophota bacterium]MCM8793183.1 D-sedoheptulose 7-phosphate isomerase [Candidatus Omnitrophota bacterium]